MPRELGRLKRVDLRKIWGNEAQDFTPWLATEENLSVLAATLQIDLDLEAVETNVGPFRADILCRTGGSKVLIENQLEPTDHSHLGQLLTYAAGLHADIICWIAERFTEEHRATLDWLNEITGDRFQFFGLEIEAWQIGDSPAAPRFTVVSSPNHFDGDHSGAARRSASGAETARTGSETPRRRQQQAFWSEFTKRLDEAGSPVRARKPQNNYMEFSIGRSGFSLGAWLNFDQKWIAVYFGLFSPQRLAFFGLLERQREEIEQTLGDLEWCRLPAKKESYIRLRKPADPADDEDRSNQINWMVSTLEAFDRTFRSRLKSLNASDWKPSHETDD